MSDKARMEAMLKEKLAQLEMGKPDSEEEVKKQKAELRAAMHEADEIFKAPCRLTRDKITALHAYVRKTVQLRRLDG
jgi:hypothetical protein